MILNVVSVLLLTVFPLISNMNNESDQFQKLYIEIGYKSVHEALFESIDHYNHDIALPIQLPPIAFTHSFGRFNDMEGNENDGFEVEYVNKNLGQNHYMIRVKPVEYGISFRNEQIDQRFLLKNESEAIFSTWIQGFHLFVFEKDGWQYILTVDKRISDRVTAEVLLEIANSIQ